MQLVLILSSLFATLRGVNTAFPYTRPPIVFSSPVAIVQRGGLPCCSCFVSRACSSNLLPGWCQSEVPVSFDGVVSCVVFQSHLVLHGFPAFVISVLLFLT